MNPTTSRVQLNQNGIYLLGQSAIDELGNEDTLLRNITKLNERMASSRAMVESFDFGNGIQVSTQEMVDRTVGGVFDKGTLSRYGFDITGTSGTNFTLNDNLDRAKLRGLLNQEGIQISDTKLGMAKHFVALDPELYIDPKGLSARAHITPFHELGHTGSAISGMGSITRNFSNSFDDLDAPIYDKIKGYFTYMALHGREEARAESFGLYSAAHMKSLGEASDVRVTEQVLKAVSKGNIAYTGSMNFFDAYGGDMMGYLFQNNIPNERAASAVATFGVLGDYVAKRSFVEDLTGQNSILARSSILHARVKDSIMQNSDLMEEIRLVSGISKADAKEMKTYVKDSPGSSSTVSKLFTRPKIAGGMSRSTLQNIIDSSLEAARVMR